MLYQRKGSRYVDAIEWTGENLKDIQTFMYPQSPLDHGNDQIGLNVYDPSATYGSKTRLVFIPKGGWIVRDEEGRLHAYSKREEFEAIFEPLPEAPPVPEAAPAVEELL